MARLTVILTLHNQLPQYIFECIDSLNKQSFKDFQILIIDDYSSIEYSWLEYEDNCIYIRNAKNLGLCESVNKAFRLVNTEYCIRLGCDDLFESDLLLKEIKFLDEHKSYIAVCCQLQRFGYSNTLIKRPEKWIKKIINSADEIIPAYHGYGYAGGVMFRTSALENCRINTDYPCCEDFDFHLQLLEHGKIKSLHEPLYLYRSHKANYCSKFKRFQKLEYITKSLKEHSLFYV